MYVFSVARINYGNVLISRVCEGEPDGRDIFKYLRIRSSEIDFLHHMRKKEYNYPVVLLGHRTGVTRAVLLFGLSSHESSVSLAIEFIGRPCDVLRSILRCGDDTVAISPEARAACEGKIHSPICESISDELSLKDALMFQDVTSRSVGGAEDFLSVILAATELVGVGVELDVLSLSHLRLTLGYVYACGFFSAAVLLIAMLARRYSKCRLLSAVALEDDCLSMLRLSFDLIDVLPSAVEEHLMSVAGHLGLPISVKIDKGRFCCEFAACRPDIAVMGVKESRRSFVYDWDQIGINKYSKDNNYSK